MLLIKNVGSHGTSHDRFIGYTKISRDNLVSCLLRRFIGHTGNSDQQKDYQYSVNKEIEKAQ